MLYCASLWCTIFASIARENRRGVHVDSETNFSQAKLNSELNGNLFLFYSIIIVYILSFLFQKKKLIKKSDEKKIYMKEAQYCYSGIQIMTAKTTIIRSNGFRPRRFIFPQILYFNVLYDLHWLLYFFSPNNHNLCFELLKIVTLTD